MLALTCADSVVANFFPSENTKWYALRQNDMWMGRKDYLQTKRGQESAWRNRLRHVDEWILLENSRFLRRQTNTGSL
jgi:hypothetical protein